MVVSALDALDVADLNVDDLEVSNMADPRVQLGQLWPGNHKSEDPVSRTTLNSCALYIKILEYRSKKWTWKDSGGHAAARN